MPVTNQQVGVLRALLAGDDADGGLSEELDLVDDEPDFGVLSAAAFYEAVNRRFGESSIGDVVRFVARARARHGKKADDIDPLSAERLIVTALGDTSAGADLDHSAKTLQIPLLAELIADERLDARTLDVFVTQARTRANQWLDRLGRDSS